MVPVTRKPEAWLRPAVPYAKALASVAKTWNQTDRQKMFLTVTGVRSKGRGW
jgi:hypothetical protein